MQIDFNQYADTYARERKVQPVLLARMVELLNVHTGDRILEVGCGTGNYLRAICSETGASGTGIDPSANMLAEASRQSPGIEFTVGRAEEIPLPDQSIDAMFSVDVIHFVGDLPAFASEAARVLSNGGRFVTATDSEEDIRTRVPLRSHFPETVDVELARYPPIEAQVKALEGAGFADIRTEPVRHAYALTDISSFRARAFSSLRLISDDAFAAGLERLEQDLAKGPIPAVSRYTVISARRP